MRENKEDPTANGWKGKGIGSASSMRHSRASRAPLASRKSRLAENLLQGAISSTGLGAKKMEWEKKEGKKK